MVQKEKRRFWIPADLAYGEKPGGGRPGAMLVFDVELLSFKEGPKPPKVPEDVASVPTDAEKTKSGLASKVIIKGRGKEHPTASSYVEVHYSGWTTDGQFFDSSVARGKTISFPLNGVIPGWSEGVHLMVEGETRRLWIPAELAYGNNPPAGMLVFDIQLVDIK